MGEVIEAGIAPPVGEAAGRLLGVLTPARDADGRGRRAVYALLSELHAAGGIASDEVIRLWHRPPRGPACIRGAGVVRFAARARRP